MHDIRINGHVIGRHTAPFIIAELSGNHNGDLGRALKLMEAAAATGAHAIKLQTYTPDIMTLNLRTDDFVVKGGLWDGHSLYQLYDWAHTPMEWHEALFAKGKELGMTVFSTPFDLTAVDFLEKFDVPAYKVASFEMTDHRLLQRIAETKKPIIMSTGMATLSEIEDSVTCLRDAGCDDLVLLHCISGYPSPADEANLRTIPHLSDAFDVHVGLSDHSYGIAVPIAATALGARVIEKHFTLRRADGGPDADFSLEPEEFTALVDGVSTAWDAMGTVNYQTKASETGNEVFRRSLYVVEDIPAGGTLTADNLRAIRPGFGLSPKHYNTVIGKRVNSAVSRGTALKWSMLEA